MLEKMILNLRSDWLRWISYFLLTSIIILALDGHECAGRPRMKDNFGLPDPSKLNTNRKLKYYINAVPDIQCPDGKRMGWDGICRDQTFTRSNFTNTKHRHNHGTNSI